MNDRKIKAAIITGTPAAAQPSWQRSLARAIGNVPQLLEALGLPRQAVPAAVAAFPVRVPHEYVARMRKGDARDPLLLQVLPTADEDRAVPGFGADPVGDAAAMRAPGVIHKYRGRVLLTLTGACAVHCRYCFRRHFPYADANPAPGEWRAAGDYIAAHAELSEVILSGGDPLSVADARLADLLERLDAIPHLRRLRIHTRLPVVLPARVTEGLMALLARSRLRPVMVLHINHAQEIDAHLRAALARLRDAGVSLLNQSVLLSGVNDTEEALAELSEALFDAGVLPYYLHQLDRVAGAHHFAVPDARALTLIERLRGRLPGYLVPRLARETAGHPSKDLLA